MSKKEQSTRGKLLYFPNRLSVRKDKVFWVRQEFIPRESDPAWLTAAMLTARARRVTVHYVEQAWVPIRGGGRQKIWLAALLSDEAWFPPLRLTPRLCCEFAAIIGLPHPRHWVGNSVRLVPQRTRGGQWIIRVVSD